MTCCPKSGLARRTAPPASYASAGADRSQRVELPGGRVMTGTSRPEIPQDGESPPRPGRLGPFAIDACAVTNDRFARFIEDTGHVTEAERYGWSFVFSALLPDPDDHAPLPGLAWWRKVDGARWNRPEGPKSSVSGRMDHPVAHVSWNDAAAFASWAGGRLPSEAEWEYAARGGLADARFPWGSREPDDTGFQPCNIWQGSFPHHNTLADGYLGTAPAQSFAPNGYGLYNMCGNTWEWTADRFRVRSLSKSAQRINDDAKRSGSRTVKGGSFLCHRSYCYRYRIAARTSNTPDTTLSHTGFRLCYSRKS